jgi:hypothetical protein
MWRSSSTRQTNRCFQLHVAIPQPSLFVFVANRCLITHSPKPAINVLDSCDVTGNISKNWRELPLSFLENSEVSTRAWDGAFHERDPRQTSISSSALLFRHNHCTSPHPQASSRLLHRHTSAIRPRAHTHDSRPALATQTTVSVTHKCVYDYRPSHSTALSACLTSL